MLSATSLVHTAAGCPDSKWPSVPTSGNCACCAQPISNGVPTADLSGDAFSRQVDFLSFGDHVCTACAWMFSDTRTTHRNFLCYNSKLAWPMISADAATSDRGQWLDVLKEFATLPPETLAVGVLTTDPKPRLWPMARLVTRQYFGLYVHCPDWDVSEFRLLDLDHLIHMASELSGILQIGFNKSDCGFGLMRSKQAKADIAKALKLEARIRAWRSQSEFIPALLMAHK